MSYKLVKRKTKNKEWLQRQFDKWAEKTKENNSFLKFDCSPFFRGKVLADINLEKYYIRNRKINRKLKQLHNFLNKLDH